MFGPCGFTRALREAAPGLSRRFFSCQHTKAAKSSQVAQLPSVLLKSTRTAETIRPTIFLHHQHQRAWQSTFRSSHRTRPSTTNPTTPQICLARLRNASSNAAVEASSASSTPPNSSRFPETSSNTVAYWLLASAASVFGIVVFGGLTRLTESGLSITEWKPVTGSLPPMSEADWAAEFLKYQSSPEFHLLNSRMTIEEFKSIYWMEWIHRLWGRAIGLGFVIPAVYFVARKQVSKPMMARLVGIAGLIGFQGFIGWWMVKSGLKDDLFAPGSHPRVSQYRLTAHLGTAFICYVAMLWNGLSILCTNKLLKMPVDQAASTLFSLRNPVLRPFKISVALLTGLIFTTAMSGGLVAGLDAGLIYNEFPYMGIGLTPPKSELFDKFYSRDPEQKDIVWRNALENPSLVQLDHRVLATTTFTSVMALFVYSRFSKNMVTFLPKAAKKGMHGVVGFVWLQVILGITTLLYLVPVPLASAHQAGSLALLTMTFVLGSRIWYPTAAAKILAQRMSKIGHKGMPGIGKKTMTPNEMAKASTTGAAAIDSAAVPIFMAGLMPVAAVVGLFATHPANQRKFEEQAGSKKEA